MANQATILITGGAGFIGTALCEYILNQTDYKIINIDALTYAANLTCVQRFSKNDRYMHIELDIGNDITALLDVMEQEQPHYIIHLAAETHVDRSIENASCFIKSNIVGTFNMLEASLRFFETLSPERQKQFKFLHISTDEVFGSLGDNDEAFHELTRYDPRSPYSASKASADHLVRAWYHTHGLPILMTNCSNNYGPWQFPEKLVPVLIRSGYQQNPMPVYGEGLNIRDWLHVNDHAEALINVLEKGKIGESYNIGGKAEMRNIDLVHIICDILHELRPLQGGHSYRDLITFVADRKGHDYRYAMNISKIEQELGWSPSYNFSDGIRHTVKWYLENPEWLLGGNSQ